MGRHLSLRYGHVILVSGYPIYFLFIYPVNSPQHGQAISRHKKRGLPKSISRFPALKTYPPSDRADS